MYTRGMDSTPSRFLPTPYALRTRKKQVNRELSALGRVYHDFIPIQQIDKILVTHGFQTTKDGIYCGCDGRSKESVGDRTELALIWHKMEVSGRYEIVAYVS